MRKAVLRIPKKWGSQKSQLTHQIEIIDLPLKGCLKTHFRWQQMKTITNKEFCHRRIRGELTQKKAGIEVPTHQGLKQQVQHLANLLLLSWKASHPKQSTVLGQTLTNLFLREPKSYRRWKNKLSRKKNMTWQFSQKFQGLFRRNKTSSPNKKVYMEVASHRQTCTLRKRL